MCNQLEIDIKLQQKSLVYLPLTIVFKTWSFASAECFKTNGPGVMLIEGRKDVVAALSIRPSFHPTMLVRSIFKTVCHIVFRLGGWIDINRKKCRVQEP